MDDDDIRDDLLVAELSQVAQRLDPVPERLVEAGIAAYTFRTIDTELAELTFDSALDGERLVRADSSVRVLSFQAADLTIELEILSEDGAVHLVGQLLPPSVVQIDVRQRDVVATGSTDGLGRFSLRLPAPGPFQLSLPYAGAKGSATVTQWISV